MRDGRQHRVMSGAGGDAGLVAAGDAWDMSQVVTGPARAGAPAHPVRRRHGLLGDLDRPGDVFARLGPNWFASVMGTGIVATAAADPPRRLGHREPAHRERRLARPPLPAPSRERVLPS
jgi:hypothetical protein